MKKFIWMLAILALLPALAYAEWQPLPPDQAYRLQVQPQNGTLLAHWDIQPGYYLYRSKFQFISHTPGVDLESAQFPAGETHTDQFFGTQEIYRGGVTASVPYLGSGPVALEVIYQGCADHGFCYPPQTRTFNLTLAAAQVADVHPPDLAAVVAGNRSTGGFPPPDQVFHFNAYAKDANTIEAVWQITGGYYLYRQKFHFSSTDPDVSLGAPDFPQGQIESDQYFGTQEIYRNSVSAMIPVTRSGSNSRIPLTVTYQGCADKGLCYPPITKTVLINFAAPGASATPAAGVASTVAANPPPVAQQNRLAELIRSGNLAWVLLVFLGLGIALCFTPCVLPMIPIIAGLIAGQQNKPSTLRAFSLSLTYVIAMALTYTVAGVVVALLGANVQAWFQNPWIVSVFALIFVLLALSMFGVYQLQMPGAIQTRLVSLSNTQRGGAFAGVGAMGVLSALIVGPCITAPLVAALLVIGQSGDPLRGGLSLFALGLGMGVPLLIVGTSASKWLPKAGAWMTAVKYFLGVLLLAVAIWFLSRILPGAVTLALWAALAIVCGVYLLLQKTSAPSWRRLWQGAGVLVGIYGVVMLVGAASGAQDPLRPLARFTQGGSSVDRIEGLQFTRIKTVADLEQAVAAASARHQTVMLDFYADWCVSCKELQQGAFRNPAVIAALGNTRLLEADVTADDTADQALLKHFGIYGPPSIMFFNDRGQELRDQRVVGYMDAQDFALRVRQAFANSTGTEN
ncbi:MAG TPA: protein-disulfide reductase DsbD [Gammaproteobacteria bacterium]|nr:protein-disulfide reductase DsbD [Gammaproteobacteria bacterium]